MPKNKILFNGPMKVFQKGNEYLEMKIHVITSKLLVFSEIVVGSRFSNSFNASSCIKHAVRAY